MTGASPALSGTLASKRFTRDNHQSKEFFVAEIIQLREVKAARERSQRRDTDHQNLERAVTLVRKSLAAAAHRLEYAPAVEQEELLDRIEKLAAMVRYGMHMLGEIPGNSRIEEG